MRERVGRIASRRRDVAEPVGVDLQRPDPVADVEVEVGCEDAVGPSDLVKAADRGDHSDRKHARTRGEEADRDRQLEARCHELVGDRPPKRLRNCDVIEIDARSEADQVCHLPCRYASGDLDDAYRAVGAGEQLRKGNAVAKAERAHRGERDRSCLVEPLGRLHRRVDVGPADAEARPLRAEPIGQREERRLSATDDEQAVELVPREELFENRTATPRMRERLGQAALEVSGRVDQKDSSLPTGIGGLEHCGKTDAGDGIRCAVALTNGRETRLAEARVSQTCAHRELVRHRARDARADGR